MKVLFSMFFILILSGSVLLVVLNQLLHTIIGVCIMRMHYSLNQIPNVLTKYVDRKEKDMKNCGMDYVTGESDNPEVNLCLEKKAGI